MAFKYLSFISILFIYVNSVCAQETEDDTTFFPSDIYIQLLEKDTGGTMKLEQEPELGVLTEKSIRINEKEGLSGFRIQIYSGSEQNAREKLSLIIQEFQESFPEFNAELIYTEYQAPYFKLRVGDFRNKNEAYEWFHQIRKKFPNSYIVKSKIKYPKLGTL